MKNRKAQVSRVGHWTKEELARIAQADDLHVSPFREDGVTYGTPTWVWCVVVGEAVYARAYHGERSSWYQAALKPDLTAIPHRAPGSAGRRGG